MESRPGPQAWRAARPFAIAARLEYEAGRSERTVAPEALGDSRNGRRSTHPRSAPFFSDRLLYGRGEGTLRTDGHKWEPCLRSLASGPARKLFEPCFDVYQHTRSEARPATDREPLPYAFILGIRSAEMPNLYNDMVRTFARILQPLRPQTRIQLTGQV